MWKLYQKCGSIKEVAKKVKRDRSTVSRYVHEYEAAVGAVSVVLEETRQSLFAAERKWKENRNG